MSTGRTSNKQQKIENILGLLRGDKSPEDIYPECVCKIGYSEENTYLVNNKDVSASEYSRAIGSYDSRSIEVTYGGEGI